MLFLFSGCGDDGMLLKLPLCTQEIMKKSSMIENSKKFGNFAAQSFVALPGSKVHDVQQEQCALAAGELCVSETSGEYLCNVGACP